MGALDVRAAAFARGGMMPSTRPPSQTRDCVTAAYDGWSTGAPAGSGSRATAPPMPQPRPAAAQADEKPRTRRGRRVYIVRTT